MRHTAKAGELQAGQTVAHGVRWVTITCVTPDPSRVGWVRIKGTYRQVGGRLVNTGFALADGRDVRLLKPAS